MRGRFDFFVLEALKSLKNNLATTTAATVTVLIVMFLAGVGIALGSYIVDYSNRVRDDVTVKVYLGDDATQRQISAIQDKVKNDARVDQSTVEFVTKEEARERAKELFGSQSALVNAAAGNPFPPSVEFRAKNPDDTGAIAASFKGMAGMLKSEPEKGLPNPDYGAKKAERVLRVAGAITAVIGIMGVVLAIAAVLLIGNTIRLSIYARRREVEVMKLVGATNWFVRWPFMLEGMICGLLGAILASGLLWLAWSWVGNQLEDISNATNDGSGAIALPLLVALLVVVGVGLGAAGAGITMRRFLRV